MDIQPASVEQIKRGQDGKIHVIHADAGGIVARLKHVDPNLSLRYSEAGEYYVVYYENPNGKEELVATYQKLDQRINEDIERLEHLMRQPDYSYAEELDKKDAEVDKNFEYEQFQKVGESAERLAYALRDERGMNDHKMFVTQDVKE